MSRKKRVLFSTEFSQLSTGFSTIARYLLPRLYKTGKYEIFEHAKYINKYHKGIDNVPWKVYPNEPDPNNKEECKNYKVDRANQFGRWKFDETCIDCQPDIVVDWSDPWMCSHIFNSPCRPFFNFIHMPTCDGEPQKQEWLETYATADMIVTYSLFGKHQLEKYSGDKIKVFDVMSPGTDLEVFKPMDKVELRKELGLDPDIFLIGTVMRNQPRKLYPDLMKAFNKFLQLCHDNGRGDIAKKTYLYFHTSHPDVGWDLPYELKHHNLSHKVLFTYMCEHCRSVYPSFFNNEVAVCRNCKNHTCHTPNTSNGVERDVLAKIMANFDLYVQYSVSEGYGMPINDAKACGVPCMAVEHSAMTEQCYNGGGIPIPVIRHFQESANQTNQLRALPDIEYTAQKMYELFVTDPDKRIRLGKEARECVEKYYNWDLIAKVWESALDAVDFKKDWKSPATIVQPNLKIPDGLNNQQFVHWCYQHILKDPLGINSIMGQKAIQALNLGYELVPTEEGQNNKMPVDRNTVVNYMVNQINQKNRFEEIRYLRCNGIVQPEGSKQAIGVIEI